MDFDYDLEQIIPESTGFITLTGNEGVEIPAGSTLQRPSAPVAGIIRINTDTAFFEYYNGTTWIQPSTGTVISVDASGGTTGLSFSGGPITSTGTLTLSGILLTSNGGTGLSSIGTANQLLGVNTGATALEYKTLTAGTGIAVSGGTGNITIDNIGVITVAGTSNQIIASTSTGNITLSLAPDVTLTSSLTISNLTPNAFLFSGASGLLTTTTPPTNGQLLIGVSNGAPVLGNIAPGVGISVSNGAGTISIVNSGVVTNVAGAGISVSGATGNVTITNTGVLSLSGGTTGLIPDVPTTGDIVLSGVLNVANGGTGLSTIPANGTIDIGNGTGFSRTTLTAGLGIGITNGAGSITIDNSGVISITGTAEEVIASSATGNVTLSLPQPIGLTSTPTFAQITISNSPVNTTDVATKAYVDSAAGGVNVHAPCEAATTSNLTATYTAGTADNWGGTGIGATLTNAGTQVSLNTGVIDGYTNLVVGDRVLIKNQTTETQNGIYTVTNLGSTTTNWVLTRATDYNNSNTGTVAAVDAGDQVFIREGTTQASTTWVQTNVGTGTNDSIRIGIDNIIFVQISGPGTYQAGTGLTLTGTTFALQTPVSISNGGTGQTTAPAAFNALSPITSTGDLIIGNGANSATRLGIGINGQVLTSTGTTAQWSTVGSAAYAVNVGPSGSIPWVLVTGNYYNAVITHNLGTNNVIVQMSDISNNNIVNPDLVTITSTNSITVQVYGNTKTLRVVVIANGASIAAGGSTPSSVLVQSAGTPISGGPFTTLNFINAAIAPTGASGIANISLTPAVGIQYNGTTIAGSPVGTINFVGATLSASVTGGVATITDSALPTIRTLTFFATSLDSPNNTDWAVNALAPTVVDPANPAITVRQFSNTTEQGVGTLLSIPDSSSNLLIRYRGRSLTTPSAGTNLQMNIYIRKISDATTPGAITSWTAANPLTSVGVSADTYYHTYTYSVPLSTLSLVPGNLYQIEFTRNVSVTNNLPYNWLMAEIAFVFS